MNGFMVSGREASALKKLVEKIINYDSPLDCEDEVLELVSLTCDMLVNADERNVIFPDEWQEEDVSRNLDYMGFATSYSNIEKVLGWTDEFGNGLPERFREALCVAGNDCIADAIRDLEEELEVQK